MGLFDNGAHSLAEQALDATWYKQRIINHNIANVDTPDFKAKTVDFAFILKQEKCKCRYHSALRDNYHSGHHHLSDEDNSDEPLKLSVITTYETNTNQILDGNNVDMEKEQMALADAQYQYGALIDYVNNNYAMIRKAISKG